MSCKCKTLSNFEMIQEFHQDFGRTPDPVDPTVTSEESRLLRAKLIFEEMIELFEELGVYLDCDRYPTLAMNKGKTVYLDKVAKETADLLYVTYGTGSSMGLPMDKIYKAVHDSNMSKKDVNGNVLRREDGKVLKSDQYKQPDIASIINGEV